MSTVLLFIAGLLLVLPLLNAEDSILSTSVNLVDVTSTVATEATLTQNSTGGHEEPVSETKEISTEELATPTPPPSISGDITISIYNNETDGINTQTAFGASDESSDYHTTVVSNQTTTSRDKDETSVTASTGAPSEASSVHTASSVQSPPLTHPSTSKDVRTKGTTASTTYKSDNKEDDDTPHKGSSTNWKAMAITCLIISIFATPACICLAVYIYQERKKQDKKEKELTGSLVAMPIVLDTTDLEIHDYSRY